MLAAMPEIFVEYLLRALLMMPVNERPDVVLVELLDIHHPSIILSAEPLAALPHVDPVFLGRDSA